MRNVKRKHAKPVRGWAIVVDGKILIGTVGAKPTWVVYDDEDCVRVEVREVVRKKAVRK